jgi:hypothetical protein
LYDDAKARKLEEEAERLRAIIAEKEEKMRYSDREWYTHERETDIAHLRTELAEDTLKKMEEDAPLGTESTI